jgi:alpha-amylase/alpha-mannosidase (GH57 family)
MTQKTRSIVIHGHFYQPPREDPWLEEVDAQPSAAPYHDWNARVEAECYRTVAAARIPGEGGRIREILNTLRFISFNFGPTLLEWMERAAPATYNSILEADRWSRAANGGHGNAIAQAYHHSILPLATRRDKVTEVRWGKEDFRRRFGRDPVGMWLPETAVDGETLDVLAQEGIAFTIVAPHQVQAVPKSGLPGLYRTPGGRTIALFVYNGPISHDVAFGQLLQSADIWADRLAAPPPEGATDPRLLAIATDGETYGHHHRFGEMALAAVIRAIQDRPGVRLDNFARFLAHSPPGEEVTLVEATSWSCAHGVERWRRECGCKMDPGRHTQQRWRTGLRDAMERLAEGIHDRFEKEAPRLLGDPWGARNEYGRVVSGSETIQAFLDRRMPDGSPSGDRTRAAELLEMERNALRVFTSCGWFFDDLAGIEPLQILRYAARALDLAGPEGEGLEERFLTVLKTAHSNESPARDGEEIFLQEAKPPVPPPVGVGAGALVLARDGRDIPRVSGYVPELGGGRRVEVTHVRTGRRFLLEVAVEGANHRHLRIRVWDRTPREAWGDQPTRAFLLHSADLPEAFRVPLEGLVLREALERWVGPEDQGALLTGAETLEEVLARALANAVRALDGPEPDGSPDASTVERVRELALLHARRGLPIPFDAQTDYYRTYEAASPNRRSALAPLREPMGFLPDS